MFGARNVKGPNFEVVEKGLEEEEEEVRGAKARGDSGALCRLSLETEVRNEDVVNEWSVGACRECRRCIEESDAEAGFPGMVCSVA